jgi:hypothetical protein
LVGRKKRFKKLWMDFKFFERGLQVMDKYRKMQYALKSVKKNPMDLKARL